ncbi:hypothetical protein [Bacillus sp. JJ722]|uniref:hypothetical protein n=1 Tax=Bacillus sp. JJ722 TaxID=3122973 RepID=UPI002FFD5C89
MQVIFESTYAKSNNYYNVPKNDTRENQQNIRSNSDTISISMAGRQLQSNIGAMKKNSMLDSLLEQKQRLTESKNQFMQEATEKGTSMDIIKERMKEFDEQLLALDEKISQQMIEERQKALNLDKKEQGNEESMNEELKTEEEIQMEKFSNLLNLSGNVSQFNQLYSAKDRMEWQQRALKTEIRLDGFSTTSKNNQISNLSERIKQTTEKIGDVLNESNVQLKSQDINLNNEIKSQTNRDRDEVESNYDTELLAYKQAQHLLKSDSTERQVSVSV